METYRHTQTGWLMLACAAVILGFSVWVLGEVSEAERFPGGVIAFSVVAVLVVLFGWLTVIVSEDKVDIRFGVGLIRKRYDLKDFVDVQVVRNRWYYGWGIRMVPKGILYNVSGLDAVELKRANAKAVRIGTDEPQELKRALREALNMVHTEHNDWQSL